MPSIKYCDSFPLARIGGLLAQSDRDTVKCFNLKRNWYAPAHLAIDQGPIIVMIENYRSGRPWKRFMAIPEIQRALKQLELAET